jgi:hypothetical protein
MRIRNSRSVVTLIAVVVAFPPLHAQSPSAPTAAKPNPTVNLPFDPHDFSGNWIGDAASPGKRNFGSWDQTIPEPPLTDWAKKNLLMKSISHDSLGGRTLPGWDRAGHLCPNNQDPCYATDPNGVPANDPEGEYPGKNCEPLAAPAIYDPTSLDLMTFFMSPERIVQLHNYHREWRIFWLNREHPKEMDPTFEGDSTAKWEGNTLVVDTVGFNGRTQITQNVGHWKSDAFRLVERFTRVDHDHLVLDMTYYDPKAWGDKSWPGFRKYFHLVPIEQVHDRIYKLDQFTEWICSPEDNRKFDQRVTDFYKKN